MAPARPTRRASAAMPAREVLRGLPEVPEGIGAVRACRLLAREQGIALPLAEVTARILEGEKDAGWLERALMQDPPGASG